MIYYTIVLYFIMPYSAHILLLYAAPGRSSCERNVLKTRLPSTTCAVLGKTDTNTRDWRHCSTKWSTLSSWFPTPMLPGRSGPARRSRRGHRRRRARPYRERHRDALVRRDLQRRAHRPPHGGGSAAAKAIIVIIISMIIIISYIYTYN